MTQYENDTISEKIQMAKKNYLLERRKMQAPKSVYSMNKGKRLVEIPKISIVRQIDDDK